MQKGDYVLAHKWSDADPGDHWCVGFYDYPMAGSGGRHMIVDGHGQPFRGNGFSHVVPITDCEGAWMIERMPQIDAAPMWVEEGKDELQGKSVLEWLAEAKAACFEADRSDNSGGGVKP